MTKVTIAKKLSMKGLVGNVKAHVKELENGQQIALASIAGIVRGTKSGESNFGPWVALTGDFMAQPAVGDKVGNRCRTGVLFLPDVAQDLVLPLVSGLGKGDGIEIAFEIGAEADETSNTGYVYTAQFLTEPEENDPLEALISKALPAPESAPAKETAKGKATA